MREQKKKNNRGIEVPSDFSWDRHVRKEGRRKASLKQRGEKSAFAAVGVRIHPPSDFSTEPRRLMKKMTWEGGYVPEKSNPGEKNSVHTRSLKIENQG